MTLSTPLYELDDGPLTPEQVKIIQRLAYEQAFSGPTLSKQSLLIDVEKEQSDK